MNTGRRSLMTILMLAVAFAAAGPIVHRADAKDGGSDDSGGGDSSGSGSSGSSSGSGSDNSGSGSGGDHDDDGDSDNSGRGNDHDDDDDDDNNDDGRDDDDGHGRNGRDADYDRARDAVRDGEILPLRTVLERIDAQRYGRVIDVTLKRSLSSDVYQVKVRDTAGAIRTLRVNARNGALLGG
ncbi:PepSY domain-containing protein [Pseudorhizobium pelagicum]|uniref:PepSY domain-containing protein n=1 Tax=Pseudorhizobium pelagicum TaxID=1509405 RepID=A0A922NYK9_9HYPH|nr:hypothetical protein [Pseudorhizobium pelagicum]KEQ03770.1 hypothetical protein GV68_16235 [Pseudorhizobium pelagicum]KEQ05525.1 hypothetical protein GV67_05245 [Pseudorhizobium pelagicum]